MKAPQPPLEHSIVPARQLSGGGDVLLLGMIVLGIVTFGALAAFITLCDRM